MENSIAQFITVTMIFIFVLAITYFTTRWIGSYQKKKMSYGNIKVIESTRLSSNKILEIVKAGDKCVLIAVCKDTVTKLTDMAADEIHSQGHLEKSNKSFQEVLDLIKKKKTDGTGDQL